MGIQEFVLISGSAQAANCAANVAHEAVRAAAAMTQEDESELRAQLAQLRQEHRDPKHDHDPGVGFRHVRHVHFYPRTIGGTRWKRYCSERLSNLLRSSKASFGTASRTFRL